VLKYENLTLVGIGSSAGGYESLQKFFLNLNVEEQENITYIVAQHLDPSHPSDIGKILSKFTTLTVKEIVNNLKIESSIVYYCPPNFDVVIKNGNFILTKPTSSVKPSIDRLFISLASEKQKKAMGIILSGSGNDGTKGIEEIAKNGGITLCEDDKAKHYYMPKSALDSGKINASLSIAVLAESIPAIIEDRHYFIKYVEIKNHLKEIFKIINKKINIDFSGYKEGTIIRRIEKRMKSIKITNISTYIEYLKKDRYEVEKLKNEFFIIVTSFFRDKEAFFALKNELKELVKKSDDNLRIWVPACATSQEAYSIAILLFEIFEELNLTKKVTIFATDISNNNIQEARTKVFTFEEVQELDNNYIDKYFDKIDNFYKPKTILRDVIVFSQHNIIKDPPFLNIDLISCRNLLIYFNSELQKQIFRIFYFSLKVDGLLFLGKSESIGDLNFLFSILDEKYKIYKKLSDLKKMDIDSLIQRTNSIPKPYKSTKSTKIVDVDDSINQAVSNIKASNGVVIDRNNNILFYKGDCSKYITHPQGLSSNNILYLVKDYLKLDLRVIINQIKNDKKSIENRNIPVIGIDDKKEYTVIEIYLLEKNRLGEETYFISFSDKIIEKIDINISKYEEEIVDLKDKLQKTLESLEVSNEELRVSNEELQSANEELQSTNEELETSNEELQSTNEELQTINTEVTTINADIEFTNEIFNKAFSILNASLLILDKNLDVIKYTDGIHNFFDLTKMKNKNLQTMLIYSKISLPNLVDDIKECLFNDKKIIYELKHKNRSYSVLIHRIDMPIFYQNNQETQQGVMLKFLDKTEILQKDKMLFQQSKMASMGEMIGNIAHQWRQPLNALSITNSHLVKKYKDNSLNDEFVEKFSTKSKNLIQKMSSTIDDFRNFFSPNKEKENFLLSDAIDSAIGFVDDSFKSNDIKLNISNTSKVMINGYKNELVQVLLVVLNNSKDAMKSTNKIEGMVDITAKEIDVNYVSIFMQDNGGGIKKEIIDKVFEPYFTTKFESDGTGIGLYMAKMIIEDSMNGSIKIENKEDGVLTTIEIPKEIK